MIRISFTKIAKVVCSFVTLLLLLTLISYSPPHPKVRRFPRRLARRPVDQCSPKNWRRLDLLLPFAPNFRELGKLRDIFLPSFELFWPIRNQSRIRLVVVSEGLPSSDLVAVAAQTYLRQQLTDRSGNEHFQMAFDRGFPRKMAQASRRNLTGFDLQKWLLFWPENFTSAEYVGFVDSDTIFVTRVANSDLFYDGRKPVVRADFRKPHAYSHGVSHSETQSLRVTEKAIGKKVPFSCMSYFPVIIKVSHVKLIRMHIQRTLKVRSFQEAFLKITEADPKNIAHFDIMCTYLWYHQRDHYHWSIFVEPEVSNQWLASFVPDDANIQTNKKSPSSLAIRMMRRHGPGLAAHWSHETYYHAEHKDARDSVKKLLQKGVCYSMPQGGRDRPVQCAALPPRDDTINSYEWVFEGKSRLYNVSWALASHKKRIEEMDKCPHDWKSSKTFLTLF